MKIDLDIYPDDYFEQYDEEPLISIPQSVADKLGWDEDTILRLDVPVGAPNSLIIESKE